MEPPRQIYKDLRKVSWGGLVHLGDVLDRLGGVFGRLGDLFGPSWGVLGASWGRLGASWGIFGASWGRLGGLLGTSWGVLGASWAVFGASWGRPETVLERLGGLLGHLGGDFIGIKQYFRGMSSWKPFFIRILVDFASKNQARKLNKSLNSIEKVVFFPHRLF